MNVVNISDYKKICKKCGHLVTEHFYNNETKTHVCMRIMEVKAGRPFYHCLCQLEKKDERHCF